MEDHNYAEPPNLSPNKPLSKKALIFEDNYKSASEAFQGCMKDIELDGRSSWCSDIVLYFCLPESDPWVNDPCDVSMMSDEIAPWELKIFDYLMLCENPT